MRLVLFVALSAFAVAPWARAEPAPELTDVIVADFRPPEPHPALTAIAKEVSPERLHATIARLVAFGTRHTASDTTSPTRGIGAARAWVRGEFEAIGKGCGGCLAIATPAQTVTGPRYAKPTEVVDVLGIQPGTSDPDRVVVISGHIDSRVSDIMNATSDAPGANDDASGVAAVLESARILSRRRFAATIVYAVLSGEEQGLSGGKVLADYAKEKGWKVEADLNNDIIGNTTGQNGVHDDAHVRIFSEGTKAVETPKQADARRYNGGEVDSPSRNLARFMEDLARRYPVGLDTTLVYRTDRYGRGGDQVRMVEAGYPAVRITEARENYDRQHQDLRTENGKAYGDVLSGVDFPYLAKVVRLNAVTLAALAWAPAPPEGVQISGAVSENTTLSWRPSSGAVRYDVWSRPTTDPVWRTRYPAGSATTLTLEDVILDDAFFGVSAVSVDGYASPIEFPGPAGAFVTAPEPPAK